MIVMSDKYVLDSSIIAAIFFREKSSKKAAKAVQNTRLVTVDIAMAEVANVGWKRIIKFDEDPGIITEALEMVFEFINTSCKVLSIEELAELSFQIALREKVTFYDSLFLAASQNEKASLLTLDERLQNTSNSVELL